jgi:hypothetical protein
MLHLSFIKPANKRAAKLVLRLKNSYWLDMVYGKFTQGFGKYYPTFIKEQSAKPVEQLERWKNEQQLPLQVSLHTSKGWQGQQRLPLIGPLAMREIVIPLDLLNNNDKQINIQLSAGFMFWEIDYAAIDFSNNASMKVTRLKPVKAKDEKGANVLPLLLKEDNNFLQQPIAGNVTVIEYPYSQMKDSSEAQTYILHAKGYYEHVRNFTNSADVNFLAKFKQPGALSSYSMQLYKQAINEDLSSIAGK